MLKTVVITRPEGPYGGAQQLSTSIKSLGLTPYHLRVLRCEALELSKESQRTVIDFLQQGAGWVVFLSPTSVYIFRDLCGRLLPGRSIERGLPIAAQGIGTVEAVKNCFGRTADFVPTTFVAEVFAEEFLRELETFVNRDREVLVPQSADGRDVFAPILRDKGFVVRSVASYRTVEIELASSELQSFKGLDPDSTCIVFMSPSAVRAAVNALSSHPGALQRLRAISVGPITSQAMRDCGLLVAGEAVEHSEAGVIELLRAQLGVTKG